MPGGVGGEEGEKIWQRWGRGFGDGEGVICVAFLCGDDVGFAVVVLEAICLEMVW